MCYMAVNMRHLGEAIRELLICFAHLLGYFVASDDDHGGTDWPKVHEHQRRPPNGLIDSLEGEIYSSDQ